MVSCLLLYGLSGSRVSCNSCHSLPFLKGKYSSTKLGLKSFLPTVM